MSFESFYLRLRQLIGDERPYSWAAKHGLKNTLASIDRYHHVPRRETLQKISWATGCDLNWLMTGEGAPFPAAAIDSVAHNERVEEKSSPVPQSDFDAFWARLELLAGKLRLTPWAESLGISKGTLSSIKMRRSIPKTSTLHQWAKKAGCNAQWLISGVGEPFPPKTFTPTQGKAKPLTTTITVPDAVTQLSATLAATPMRKGEAVEPRPRLLRLTSEQKDLFENVVIAVEEFLEETGLVMANEKKATLMAIVFDYFLEEGELNAGELARIIKLTV